MMHIPLHGNAFAEIAQAGPSALQWLESHLSSLLVDRVNAWSLRHILGGARGVSEAELLKSPDTDSLYVLEDGPTVPAPVQDFRGRVSDPADNAGRHMVPILNIETQTLIKKAIELYAYEDPVGIMVENLSRDLLEAEMALFQPQLDISVGLTGQFVVRDNLFSTTHLDGAKTDVGGMEAVFVLAHPNLKPTLIKRGAFELVPREDWYFHPGVLKNQAYLFAKDKEQDVGTHRLLREARFYLSHNNGDITWMAAMLVGMQLYDAKAVARYEWAEEEKT